MSRFLIDEQGNVKAKSTNHKDTYFEFSSEEVDGMISNGKFTEDEVAKIKANRLTHAQKVTGNDGLVINPSNNSSASSEEEPLPVPALNFDKPNAEDKQNEEKKKVSDNVKGEQPLEIPSTA